MSRYSVTVELEYRDISMLLSHLHQSSRDGWYYGHEAHFCKRRNKLIEILEAKLPQEPLP